MEIYYENPKKYQKRTQNTKTYSNKQKYNKRHYWTRINTKRLLNLQKINDDRRKCTKNTQMANKILHTSTKKIKNMPLL